MSKKPRYMPGSTLRYPDKPMNKVNAKRRAQRESEGLVYGPHHDYMRTLGCVLADVDHGHHCVFTKEQPNVVGHHLKSVGSGGEDRNNQVPVCGAGHIEFHGYGIFAMCDMYGVDFRSLACEYTERYDREAAPPEQQRTEP